MKRNSLRTHLRSIAGLAPSGLIMARIRLARTGVAVLLLLLLILAGNVFSQVTLTSPDWVVGDVFVGVGSGSYQVWHSANPTANNPTYTLQTSTSIPPTLPLSDGLGGTTGGCGFDLGYRFFGTNLSNTKVDRYSIDNAHPIVEQIPSGSGATHSQSVAFDGGKNLYIGYADGVSGGLGKIEQWAKDTTSPPGPTSTLGKYMYVQSFSVPVDNTAGPGWIDLASDGHTIFYTSQGATIRKFDTSTLTASTYATLSGGTVTLYAIRILPPGDGTAGVLVAGQSEVKLVTSSGGVTKIKFGSNSNLQALTLDPSNPATTFWVGDATSNNFFRYNISTGQKVSLNTGSGTTLGGICVDGGFSAAELNSLQTSTQSTTLHPDTVGNQVSNTAHFTSLTGTSFTATFPNLANDVTVTLHNSLVDPSVALSDPTVFSFNFGNPNFGTSTFPGNVPCDQTLTALAGFPNTCEVFEFEANPNFVFSTPNVIIDTAANESTPNLRVLRNLDEDTTSGVINYPTIGKQCVVTVNKQTSNSNFEICGGGFSSPAGGQTFTKKQTASIAFKFKVSPTGQCPNGTGPANLQPLLQIVQLFPPDPTTGVAPAPAPVQVIVAGNSGGPPTFVLSGNTWQLQVKTTDMPAGSTFIATMIDLSSTVPSISVTFSLN